MIASKGSNSTRYLAGLLAAALSCGAAFAAEPTPMDPDRLAEVESRMANLPEPVREVYINEHAGDTIPLNLQFRDSNGESVRLADYFDGEHPVILTLNYYRCPKLCDVMLNDAAKLVNELDKVPGEEYRVVTVGFDPAESPALARMKRSALLNTLDKDRREQAGIGWAFLTGEQPSIDALTEAVGFNYTWLESEMQYAHPSVLIVLSPDGKITRYIYGMNFDESVVRLSLVEASDGKISTPLEMILLTCFHYSPSDGKYTATAMGLMRLGGALTVLAIAGGIGLLLLREFVKRRKASVGHVPAGAH